MLLMVEKGITGGTSHSVLIQDSQSFLTTFLGYLREFSRIFHFFRIFSSIQQQKVKKI